MLLGVASAPGAQDGDCVIDVRGRWTVVDLVAGTYDITVLDGKSQDRLPGTPFKYVSMPGRPVPGQSEAKFGASLSKEGVVMAGRPLEVAVTLRDQHGNISAGARVSTVGRQS